jgi:hypothetical protein
MPVYTVHEPRLRATEAMPNPDRFVFVRDGFYFWAFLLTALWMVRHRLWLVLAIYVVIGVGLDYAMHYAGVPTTGVIAIELLIAILIGIEGGTLRRFTLARRGWRNVGVVSGHDIEDAERRFFDGWIRSGPEKAADAATGSRVPSPLPRMSQSPDIIGLFPEPGASR